MGNVTMIEAEHLSEDEANRRGFAQLRDEAARRPITVDGPHGSVLLVNAADAEDALQDLQDMVVVLSRRLTDRGERFDLEDVIAELGITEDEIAEAED